LLRLPERAGGRSRVSRDDYLEGAPELIVEVAATSASHDLHDKRKVYRRNGVREYLVWLVRDRRALWFVLDDDEYQPLQPGTDGLARSRIFPGLALNVQALLDGDLARVLADQQGCLKGEEHRRFVELLRQTAGE
jgi:Uma2 family endonuclease